MTGLYGCVKDIQARCRHTPVWRTISRIRKVRGRTKAPYNHQRVVDMMRNHGNAPSHRCDRGALYLVWRVGGNTRKLLVHDQQKRWSTVEGNEFSEQLLSAARGVVTVQRRTHEGWRFGFRRAKITSPSRPRDLALRQCVRDARVLWVNSRERMPLYTTHLYVSTLFFLLFFYIVNLVISSKYFIRYDYIF